MQEHVHQQMERIFAQSQEHFGIHVDAPSSATPTARDAIKVEHEDVNEI